MPSSTDVRILRAAVWAARHRALTARPAQTMGSIDAALERAFYRRGFPLHYRTGGQGHRTLVPSEAAGRAVLAQRVRELKQAGWRQSEKYQRAEEPMPYSEAEAADAAERTDADHIAAQFASAFSRRGYVERYAGPLAATPVHETLSKVSQVNANYKPAFGSARCAACAHYREHACEIVEGRIEPNDVCDFYTPAREDRTARISEHYTRQAAAAQLGQWVEVGEQLRIVRLALGSQRLSAAGGALLDPLAAVLG